MVFSLHSQFHKLRRNAAFRHRFLDHSEKQRYGQMLRTTARDEISAFLYEFQSVDIDIFIPFVARLNGIGGFGKRGRIEHDHAERLFFFAVFP